MNHKLAATVVAEQRPGSIDPIGLRFRPRDRPTGARAGDLPATFRVRRNVSLVA